MDNISLRDWFAGQALIAIADDCGMTDEEVAERCYQRADALLAESKKRETPAEPTPPQPDDDGWIKWGGGECPVPEGTIVDVKYRDGSRRYGEVASSSSDAEGSAVGAFWRDEGMKADIRFYRIVSEAGVTK